MIWKKDRVAHMLAAGLSANDIIRSNSNYSKNKSFRSRFPNNTSFLGGETAASNAMIFTGMSSPTESRKSNQIFGSSGRQVMNKIKTTG